MDITKGNTTLKPTLTVTIIVVMILTITSCITKTSNSNNRGTAGVSNSPDSVSSGYGRILHDNPIILSGNENLSPDVDLSTLLSTGQDFITYDPYLKGDCRKGESYSLDDCFEIRESSYSDLITHIGGKWAFSTSSSEFLQVHSYGHLSKQIEKFHDALDSAYQQANPVLPCYKTAIPAGMYYEHAYWDPNRPLILYSNTGESNSAYFSPSNFTISIGQSGTYSNVKWSQDPTIIYHETGHALTQIMLNLRNTVAGLVTQSDLGYIYFDEAGAIGEGIADFYSYVMNGRTHFAEWALKRFLNLSRPLSEDDPIHLDGISKSSGQRLSYPDYINYDPNNLDILDEDIHYTGMITSHYLVALVEDLKATCYVSSMTEDENQKLAVNNVLYILAETFSELGDLTGKGSDSALDDEYAVNLNGLHSEKWISTVNPINYYSFYQRIAKYLYLIFNGNDTKTNCAGTFYPKNNIEQLLDQYGLLMFDTYNEDGGSHIDDGGTPKGHSGTHTAITVGNRLHTVLVSKDLISFNPEQNSTKAYVFDNRSNMKDAVAALLAYGQIASLSHLIETDLPYNNGNGKISPGEIIGLSLNLYNDSNSPIGGIQILGNDWDHIKNGKPCNTFADEFPLASEGAADSTSEPDVSTVHGDCNYITRNNGENEPDTAVDSDPTDPLAPVCFIQISDENATIWATQEEFRQEISLEKKNCLGGSENTNDCMFRAIPGADFAFFSKIDPKSTWAETLSGSAGSPTHHFSNLIFFEVSPWIPPGTTFDCRFRVRFSNCSDCFTDPDHNNDNYLDYEYSGGKPFKILHFQFMVTN